MRQLSTLLALALLGVAGWYGTVFYKATLAANRKPPPVATVRVVRGDLPLTLSGDGALEASKTFTITNEQVDTTIVDIVPDGVMVQKGQVVARLDQTKIEKDLRDRKLAYEDSKAQTKKVESDEFLNVKNASTKTAKAEEEQRLLLSSNRADLAQSQAKAQFDRGELSYKQRDLSRTQGLAKDRLVPAANVEEADLGVRSQQYAVTGDDRDIDAKQEEQRSAKTKGELLITDAQYSATVAKNKSDEATANARFNEEAARRLLQLSEMQLKWCEVRSPVAGLAVLARTWDESNGSQRPLRPGDPARPSQRFMSIIDLSHMRIAADMNEMDTSQLKVGQPARLWPRSAPGQVMKGRVLSIGSTAHQADFWRAGSVPGKKTFRVVIEVLESRPELLRPGMTADFEIVQGVIPHVVRVPLQAVFRTPKAGARSVGSGPGWVVFVKKGGRFVPHPVQLAARNANDGAVVSGLGGGEEIALQRPPLELLHVPVAKGRKQPDMFHRALGLLFWAER